MSRKIGRWLVIAGGLMVVVGGFITPWVRYPLVGIPALAIMIIGVSMQLGQVER